MLKWLIDPAGNNIDIIDCLHGALGDFYPMPYIILCIQERQWTGIPSTTQLINGTRQEYLQHFVDYALDPDKCAFRINGTQAHSKLAKLAPIKDMAEFSIPDYEISMIADLLEIYDNNKANLIDYKIWGSFKVMQALGLVKHKRPLLDCEGNPIRYKKKCGRFLKGDIRTETYFERDLNAVNISEATLQLNRYRILIEEYFGIEILKMRLFIIVKEGGLQIAKQRGLTRNTYYPEIKRVDDNKIKSYFEKKRRALLDAIDGYETAFTSLKDIPDGLLDKDLLRKYCPPVCTPVESWNGRKCEGFCPVVDTCREIFKKQVELDAI